MGRCGPFANFDNNFLSCEIFFYCKRRPSYVPFHVKRNNKYFRLESFILSYFSTRSKICIFCEIKLNLSYFLTRSIICIFVKFNLIN